MAKKIGSERMDVETARMERVATLMAEMAQERSMCSLPNQPLLYEECADKIYSDQAAEYAPSTLQF